MLFRLSTCLAATFFLMSPFAPAQPQTAAPAAATIPSYPDTPKRLEKLVKRILELLRIGDTKDLAAYSDALALPHPEEWFNSVYGGKIGAQLSSAYKARLAKFPLDLAETLSRMLAEKKTHIEAVRFVSLSPEEVCIERPGPVEVRALRARIRAEPLYEVRFQND